MGRRQQGPQKHWYRLREPVKRAINLIPIKTSAACFSYIYKAKCFHIQPDTQAQCRRRSVSNTITTHWFSIINLCLCVLSLSVHCRLTCHTHTCTQSHVHTFGTQCGGLHLKELRSRRVCVGGGGGGSALDRYGQTQIGISKCLCCEGGITG